MLPYMPSPFIEVMENIDFKCHCQNMRAYFKTCLLLEFHLPYQKLFEDACITTLTLKFPLLSLVNEEVSKKHIKIFLAACDREIGNVTGTASTDEKISN